MKKKRKKKRKGENVLIVYMDEKIEEWKIKIEKWYYNIFIINKVVIAYY